MGKKTGKKKKGERRRLTCRRACSTCRSCGRCDGDRSTAPDIMNRIQIVLGEVFRVIPGSLYPALHRLEASGMVKAEWGACGKQSARKILRTDLGRKETAR